jgi:cytochrome b6-f complex iron-sulfur subunit
MRVLVRIVFGLILGSAIGQVAFRLSQMLQHTVGPRRVTRRSFLRNVVLGSVGVVALEAVAGFVYFFWPNKTGAFGGEIAVPVSLIPPIGSAPYRNQAGKFFIINNEDGALALYWKCPHLGCTVPWNEEAGEWHCPCHGSVYNRFGERIAGPAPRPMDLMEMRQEPDGTVIVDTGQIIMRSEYTPDQAVRLTA